MHSDCSAHPARASALPARDVGRLSGRARALILGLAAVLLLALAFADLAEARRLGGGKSFGSRPSYSRPAAPPSQSPGMQRQAAPGQAAPGQAMPGRLGGLGGMFGGLLMGGLIGSMLFGGGFAGPGLLDLLLLAGGAMLLFRFLRARRQAADSRYARASAYGQGRDDGYGHADFPGGSGGSGASGAGWGGGWSHLGGEGRDDGPAPVVMPAGVDEREFLAGAKALYARLQGSWDRRDLADIREFASPEVYAEIEAQAAADPVPGRTEILMIDARVLEAREIGHDTVIGVFFDVLLREDAAASAPTQTREVWHFSRDESAAHPEWKLEGIQQLEM